MFIPKLENFVAVQIQTIKNGIFRLDYLCSIGDKEAATALATTKYEDSTLTTNRRLDAIFALFRIAYFHGCNVKEMGKTINKVIIPYSYILAIVKI